MATRFEASPHELFGAIVRGEERWPRRIAPADVEAWRGEGADLLAADLAAASEDWGIWPAEDADALRARRREAATLELAVGSMVRQVLGEFDAAGIGALVLKGAALAYRLYPAPWLRPREDTDLLVDAGLMARAADVLRSEGYIEQPSLPGVTGQRQFVRDDPARHVVDLHARLGVPSTFAALDGYPQLARRAVSIPALGARAAGLAAPDALLHACVHRVAHHKNSTALLWLYDIHLLASELDAHGWRQFAELASRTDTRAICATGLDTTVALCGTSVPADIGAALATGGPEQSAAFLRGSLSELQIQTLSFLHLPGWRARAAFVRAHLFPPAAFMLATYRRQPVWLPFLYLHRIARGSARWLTRQA